MGDAAGVAVTDHALSISQQNDEIIFLEWSYEPVTESSLLRILQGDSVAYETTFTATVEDERFVFV